MSLQLRPAQREPIYGTSDGTDYQYMTKRCCCNVFHYLHCMKDGLPKIYRFFQERTQYKGQILFTDSHSLRYVLLRVSYHTQVTSFPSSQSLMLTGNINIGDHAEYLGQVATTITNPPPSNCASQGYRSTYKGCNNCYTRQ